MTTQSAHCHVCLPTPYLLSSWHPIVLASHLFHSRIVSAPRTLFEPLLTMSLSHWHWPRVWDHPTLRDWRDCMHACLLPYYGIEWYPLICYHTALYPLCTDIGIRVANETHANHKIPEIPSRTLKNKLSSLWLFDVKAKPEFLCNALPTFYSLHSFKIIGAEASLILCQNRPYNLTASDQFHSPFESNIFSTKTCKQNWNCS